MTAFEAFEKCAQLLEGSADLHFAYSDKTRDRFGDAKDREKWNFSMDRPIENKQCECNCHYIFDFCCISCRPKPVPRVGKSFGEWWNEQGRKFVAGDDIHVQRLVMGVCERAWFAAKAEGK